MRNKIFLIISTLLILDVSTKAQEKYEPGKNTSGYLRGFVADSLSLEPVPFANVFIKQLNRGAITDSRGFFVIASLPPIVLEVEFSCIGYSKKKAPIFIQPETVTNIKVLLSSGDITLRTIEAVGKKNSGNEPNVSLQRISMAELQYQPKGIEEDIFRSVQNLAGIQTGGDFTTGFYVRGSASNENLILLDNTPLYNPYHSLGILSSIDPDVINSIEVYKGGFPAEYTGRLSSVLKINTKNGNKNFFSGQAGLSLLTSKLLLEGPLPAGSFILSGRKNYSDEILKKFNNDNPLPSKFYDLFAKINLDIDKFIENGKLTLTTFLSDDKVDNDNPKMEDFNWKNNLMELNYLQLSDSPLFYQINVSTSNFEGERIPNESGAKYLNNAFKELLINIDFSYVYESKDILKGGIKIDEIESKELLRNSFGAEINQRSKGADLSAYIDYQWLRNTLFGASIGLRVHGTRLAAGGPAYCYEPRTSFTFRLTPEFALKGSWGLYMQDLVTSTDENEIFTPFEPWIITPDPYKPSTAIQYSIGTDIDLDKNISVQIESYYKAMQNLLIVNMNKIYMTDPDYLAGKGESYGLEFTGKFHSNWMEFTCAYAWMKALKKIGNFTYSPRYDTRNNLNLSLQLNLGWGLIASASWIYNTGRPYTKIAGYYDQLTPTQLSNNDFLLNSYSQSTIYSTLNGGSLPDYHRLDLSIAKKIQIDRLAFSAEFGVINVYNRKNLFYIRTDTGERVNMLPFMPSLNAKVEL